MSTLFAFSTSPPCLTKKSTQLAKKKKSAPPITCVSSDTENFSVNRRNVCVGGGLYGAAATFGNMAAAAAPVQPPDINDIQTCKHAVDDQLVQRVMCCPPYGTPSEIIDFTLYDDKVRMRKAAHKLSSWEVGRFRNAVRTMKEVVKPDHPWNWMQQAQIHCAFCNDGYKQVGHSDQPLQVHGSWLFLPWHRYYIYFWEKILGKLIDDPTFAIPYWQWDVPEGMKIPYIYRNPYSSSEKNSLYNCNRNPDHVSAVMDLMYARTGQNVDDKDQNHIIGGNLCAVHSLMNNYLGIPECFMGGPVQAGEKPSRKGQMEHVHDVPHTWVGQPDSPFWDMGNFHTAAREPLFWAHHANIDRLWSIYRKNRRYKIEFPEDDWLESSFIFYDENNNVVKCKVRDSLHNRKLNYDYEDSDSPEWYPCSRKISWQGLSSPRQPKTTKVSEFGDKPRELNKTIRALVPRPMQSVARTKYDFDQKYENKQVEIIRIEGFKFNPTVDVRVDVYINKPENVDEVSSDYGEFVGSFVHIPHTGVNAEEDVINDFCLALPNLKNLDAVESDQLVVTLVPRSGLVVISPVTIKKITDES